MENAESDAEEATVDKARLKTFHRVLLIGRQKCENLFIGNAESLNENSLIKQYKICNRHDIIIHC